MNFRPVTKTGRSRGACGRPDDDQYGAHVGREDLPDLDDVGRHILDICCDAAANHPFPATTYSLLPSISSRFCTGTDSADAGQASYPFCEHFGRTKVPHYRSASQASVGADYTL